MGRWCSCVECVGYDQEAGEDADTQRNQCDGCQQEAPLRDGLHIDKNGHAFMACQKQRYEKHNMK